MEAVRGWARPGGVCGQGGRNVPTCVPKRSAELSDVQCRKLGGVAAKCSSSHSSKERVGSAKEASAILSGLILAIGVGHVLGRVLPLTED